MLLFCCWCLLLYVDVVVSIREVEVHISKVHEPALVAHLVVDGRDTCRVGFLKKKIVKHALLYAGKLAHITQIYIDDDESSVKKNHRNGGCARAELLEWVDLDELDNDNNDDDDDDYDDDDDDDDDVN